ncbi:sigma-70 family RNA polymerase sigma factor [Tersicoccus sp. Bi-70]|uniref:sigma-70 family RNA polymerase sigma factor n=1 Tax=Tersicoccus sp. Bi-70 TaxID=1897634 RepID=UPI0009784ECD|nr:sigma-70 family RNA polymerase sigma factor [Tersicoccus sp. Bi-70]OMH31223.1 RNA polymerase subunit sigma-70 [Tersicoccus sp. Bi-70]
MDATSEFEHERPRLLRVAARVLGDPVEAEDVVQQAWLRMHTADGPVENLPAWLTTVTTRLCLDRLKARVAVPVDTTAPSDSLEETAVVPDPADAAVLTDAVGGALGVVLDRLSPAERVAFVLHDSFAVDFPAIAGILDTSPVAARKLASRARAKVAQPSSSAREDHRPAAWEVVDAFMAAAREGELGRLVALLAPDARITADEAAVLAGTPERIEGRDAVAAFFNGSAQAALPVFVGDGPGSAWYHRGRAAVFFDFTVLDGQVREITFRADAAVLARVRRRRGADFA